MKLVLLTIFCLTVPLIYALTEEQEKDLYKDWEHVEGKVLQEFRRWKEQFSRSYSNEEEEKKKFEAFKENLEDVIEFNKNKSHLYKKGLNAYSDLTEEERKKQLLSNIDINKVIDNNHNLPVLPEARQTENLPKSVDWVAKGVLAPILNQGSCGSCYSFATVAAVEAAYAIKYKKKPPVLSTQQIVDCSLNKINLNGVVGNYGCNGGYYAHSLTFLKNSGARYSKNYPYTGTEGKCKSSSGPSVLKVTKIYTSAHQIGDVEAIKAALNKGPLMAYIYASNNFMEYGQGIYTGGDCQSQKTSCPLGVNHAINLVGYGTTEDGTPFWKIRNSWGTHWGEAGYARILMGQNICCVEASTVYAEVK